VNRKVYWPLLAACVAAVALTAGVAFASQNLQNRKNFEYTFGLWGDFPYSDLQAQVGVPNLIADMNNSDIEFSINDGDLKVGSGIPNSQTPTTCSDALYLQALGYLNALEKPAMLTPGDNDWTDCDRPANGGFNSLERLDHERDLFFSTPFSLGQRTMRQEVQATPLCNAFGGGQRACVENRRWTFRGITYATFNVQGSCNNLCDTAPDPAEFAARSAADIQWVHDTFAEAAAMHSAGVVLVSQADPGFDQTDAKRAPLRDPQTLAETDGQPDGFQTFLQAVRADTITYKRSLIYVHGDSQFFANEKKLLGA